MAKKTYEAPEAELVQLMGDVVTASMGTETDCPGVTDPDGPGFGGEDSGGGMN